GTLRLQYTRAGVVLGSDQLDMVFLTLPFTLDDLTEIRVKTGDIHGLCEHDGAFVVEEGETGRPILPERLFGARNTGDASAERQRRSYSRFSTTAVQACARFKRL